MYGTLKVADIKGPMSYISLKTGIFDIGHFKIGHFQFIPMERTKKTLNDPKIKRENPEARVTVNGFKHHAQVKVILEFKVTSELMLV